LDADGLCCRLEKGLSTKQDATDSIRTQKQLPSIAQISLKIDYKELQIGKLVGSGEFAGWFD